MNTAEIYTFGGVTITRDARGITSTSGKVPDVIIEAIRLMSKYKVLRLVLDNGEILRVNS